MATYSNRFTKFGNKTETEIAVLSSTYTLEVGDNVYNTTINKEEYWTGNHWINDDCVEVTASTAVNLGNVVSIDPDNLSATSAICELSLSTRDDWQIGVIYRRGSANTKVLVALKGYYKVKFTAATTTTTRQHIAQERLRDIGDRGTSSGSRGPAARPSSPRPEPRPAGDPFPARPSWWRAPSSWARD